MITTEQTVRAADPDVRWLRAAAAIAERLPLFVTPHHSGDQDLYDVIADLASQLSAGEMLQAKRQLAECGAALKRTVPRPAALDDVERIASDYWTPQVDAAFFLGLVKGARLASVLGVSLGSESADGRRDPHSRRSS